MFHLLFRHELVGLACMDGVTEQNLEGSSALTGAPPSIQGKHRCFGDSVSAQSAESEGFESTW